VAFDEADLGLLVHLYVSSYDSVPGVDTHAESKSEARKQPQLFAPGDVFGQHARALFTALIRCKDAAATENKFLLRRVLASFDAQLGSKVATDGARRALASVASICGSDLDCGI